MPGPERSPVRRSGRGYPVPWLWRWARNRTLPRRLGRGRLAEVEPLGGLLAGVVRTPAGTPEGELLAGVGRLVAALRRAAKSRGAGPETEAVLLSCAGRWVDLRVGLWLLFTVGE